MGNGVTVSNTASVSQQQIIDSLTAQLAKSNERLKELEQENAILKEHKHDAYYAERNWNELHGDES